LKVVSSSGEDIIPLQDFYTGEGKSPRALSADQIVAEIQVPEVVQEARAAYLKFRFREGIDFPVVGVAVLAIKGGSQGTSRGVRIVVSGATSGPFRCVKAERILENGKIESTSLEEAGETAAGEIPIVSSSGCSVSYRRTLVKELVNRGAKRVLS
jgi:CO/xanthine dehydrogenase FAD-binding subunit